jgi:diguanylate cyclase (GGDEF)-like protein/PAS domain S-box-containing protein
MKTQPRLSRTVQLGFGAAILALLAVGTISYRGIIASANSDQWVRHTHEVLENLQTLISTLRSAELSCRGFVLTGQESYITAYHTSVGNIQADITTIGELTADNPVQQRAIPILESLAAQKAQFAETAIELRRTKGMQAAADYVRDGPGPRVTDEYLSVIRGMRDEERRLLVARDADAHRRAVETKAILIVGTLLGVLIALVAGWGAQREYSARALAEEALFAEKERAQVTLNSIGDAVICTDISGNVTFLNFVAEKMTGWSQHDAAGRAMSDVARIVEAGSGEAIANPMELAVAQNRTMNIPSNCQLIQRDGTQTPIEDSVSPIRDRNGQASGAVMVFRDASAARAMTRQMTYSAQHDFLTGLPNRMLLNDRIRQAIVLAPRHKKKIALLFLDLDGFKHINDSLGHPTGDKLLQSIAERLGECVRGSDTVSRQGGDEFVVLLSEIEHAEDAAITARRMLQVVAEPHSVDDHDLHVTTSIGLSVYPDDGLDSETLIKNADTAMYQAKENGRQSYQFFKPAMNVRAVQRQSIEEDLRRALKRGQFSVQYQPKINLRTGFITGAEALIRWVHPTRGAMPPGEFIPVAEDSGLILPMGQWVLREACRQARTWADAGLPLATMAVNISAIEFRDENFLETVFAILEDARLDPKFLELELTESVLMKRAESAETILKTLRARKVQIAIDDFGTGYSSLSYLRRFPIDVLKIDQSFVHQITTAPDDTTIVTAIISMGRSLNLRVVAEGVETQQEMEFLQAHECEEAQGYYFSRPVIATEFANLLKTGISETTLR